MQSNPQLAHQAGEVISTPAHPIAIFGVGWRFAARGLAIQHAGVIVVAEIHWPGEVIIQLDAIHATALHDLHDQADEALPHPGMGRVEPDPQVLEGGGAQVGAMQGIKGAAIGTAQHPVWIETHHLGISWFHQAIFEPGHHLHAMALACLGDATNRIQVGVNRRQGGFQRGITAAVKRGAATPDVWVDGVETSGSQFGHRCINPLGIVIKGTGAVGHPYAYSPSPGLGQAADTVFGQAGRRYGDHG